MSWTVRYWTCTGTDCVLLSVVPSDFKSDITVQSTVLWDIIRTIACLDKADYS